MKRFARWMVLAALVAWGHCLAAADGIDEPRNERSGGEHDDRQRIYRATCKRIADGIRRRNESLDSAPNGRISGLNDNDC